MRESGGGALRFGVFPVGTCVCRAEEGGDRQVRLEGGHVSKRAAETLPGRDSVQCGVLEAHRAVESRVFNKNVFCPPCGTAGEMGREGPL